MKKSNNKLANIFAVEIIGWHPLLQPLPFHQAVTFTDKTDALKLYVQIYKIALLAFLEEDNTHMLMIRLVEYKYNVKLKQDDCFVYCCSLLQKELE